MARLISAKCPNCKATFQLDPQRDVATCPHCYVSSSVRTDRRRAAEVLEQHGFVIDAKSRNWSALVIACGLPAIVGGMGALAWASVRARAASQASEIRQVPPAASSPQRAAAASELQGPVPTVAPTAPLASTLVASGKSRGAKVSEGAFTVSGRISKEVVQRGVRQSLDRLRMCYERGLARSPALHGTLTVRFVIGRDGTVSNAVRTDAALPDLEVTQCTLATLSGLTFPPPNSGIVTVTYPVVFSVEARR